jgi:AcrR family transcriptional regulator
VSKSEKARPRRPAREPEGNARERILAAALEVFSERGFDGARTRDIAERAGANLGLINYYFEGKQKLWQAAVASAFGELQLELGAAPAASEADGDERARLERLLRRFVHFIARRPAFMRLMNDEGKRDSPRMRWLADHHVRPLSDALRRLVEAAQARGALPPMPAVSLHYIALGAAGLLFSQAPECLYVTGVDPTAEGFVEAHADALVRILLGPSANR